jgi:ATP-dependent Clp protease ATP-binding subunit ClpB
MTLPKTIPTRSTDGFGFINEIDFFEYKKRLPRYIGEEGYEKPTAENVAVRIPRVVGFLDEIARAQEILTSSLTNSVYATGLEGVGKTALLLGLLNKVALGEASPALLSKHYFIFNLHQFFKLSFADQVTKFDAAMDYMAKINSLIIIDRIDDFIANCGPDRSRRLMSSLINALENERVSAFVTSQAQNHQSIDQTSTLFVRYFKQLPVEQRSADEARHILRQMVPRFQRRHKVIIGDDVVTEIIRLDQRYEGRLKGQSPNRQVEFLDQLASSVNIAKYGKPIDLLQQEMGLAELRAEEEVLKTSVKPSIKKINEAGEKIRKLRETIQPRLDAWNKMFGQIRQVREDLLEAMNLLAPLQEKYERYQAQKEKQAERRQAKAAAQDDGEEVAPIAVEDVPQPLTEKENKERDRWIKVEKALRIQLPELEQGVYVEAPHVTVADVQARFTKVTGATGASATNDAERLLKMEDSLGVRVFGQRRGKATAARVYRSREAGTSDPTRPAGVVLFSGATGSAKTELVEALAEFDGTELIVYNMSEYTTASSVSRMIGADPGLVGFGEIKTLPSAVRERPKSIVFFDEIEKAHPNMQRAIMQIMDKGKMNDEYGVPVSFKDTLIFMATNVLVEDEFSGDERQNDKIVRAKLLAKENPLTREKYFLPEVIGRVDAVEIFDNVTPDIAKLILYKNVREINKGISARGYMISLDEPQAQRIIDNYFDASQGGRSIKQLSTKVLRPLTTEWMLTRQAKEKFDEDGELRPMVLEIDGKTISLDGFTLDSVEPGGPTQPVPKAGFKVAAAANLA